MKRSPGHEKYFKNYKANKVVWAAQLRKGNFKTLAAAVDYHGAADTVEVDETTHTIKFTTSSPWDRDVHHLRLGDFIIFENAGPRVVAGRHFKDSYTEIYPLPSYYSPTDDEVKIIEALGTDDEYCYNYDYITSETGLDRAAAKKAVDNLRKLGVVKFWRGLMNDDGEVQGAGFNVDDRLRAEALLYRHYREGRHYDQASQN